jgi:hypothetical protein
VGSDAQLPAGWSVRAGLALLTAMQLVLLLAAGKVFTTAAGAAGAACNATHVSSCGFLWQPAPAKGMALQLGASFMAHRWG